MARTQEQRNERRKKLFANELSALRQAEGHWQRAADAWGVENEHLALAYECRARVAENKAARSRSQQEFLNWEEDVNGVHKVRELENLDKGDDDELW